jgi:hypothetical protein
VVVRECAAPGRRRGPSRHARSRRHQHRRGALDIAALLANAPVEPHAYLGAERAARFAATLTPLRPVMVFETERGLLLADGYHRVAAARLRGERTIEAEVRLGSWDDALRYVASRRGNTSDEVPAQITPGTDGA